METKIIKIIPFDLEIAKKIQAGEIEGEIKTKCGNDVRILCFDLIDPRDVSFPMVCALYNDKSVRIVRFTKCGRYSGAINSELDLILEVPDTESQKPQFNPSYSIEQLNKLKEYTKQLMEVNQGVIDDLGNMLQELKKICNSPLKTEFKPFDKVLVRDGDTDVWVPALYQFYSEIGISERHHFANDIFYIQCIPYEGNEHLVGTTNK